MTVSHVDEFISPVTLTKASRKPSRITRSSCRAFCFLQVTASSVLAGQTANALYCTLSAMTQLLITGSGVFCCATATRVPTRGADRLTSVSVKQERERDNGERRRSAQLRGYSPQLRGLVPFSRVQSAPITYVFCTQIPITRTFKHNRRAGRERRNERTVHVTALEIG